jgi:hypothetical protein
MAHPRQPASTRRDLATLLAAWLIVIVLVQGFVAAQARVLGPLHSHRPESVDHSHASGAALFTHRRAAEAQHAHDGLQRHRHHAGDASVVPSVAAAAGDAAMGESVGALLAAAFSVMLPASDAWRADDRRHVWAAAQRWAASRRSLAPPRRPPRH